MSYLIWSLPSLVVAGAIGIGRIKTTYAAALGLAVTILIAWLAGALPFGPGELAGSMARGAWIGVTIASYIFGGLLFWQFASRDARSQATVRQLAPLSAQDCLDGRRLLFSRRSSSARSRKRRPAPASACSARSSCWEACASRRAS